LENFEPLRDGSDAMRPACAIGIGVLVPAFRVWPGTDIYDLASLETMVAAAAQGSTPAENTIDPARDAV
jgi:hypothetical protein